MKSSFIKLLGAAELENAYLLQPDEKREWWITHKVVGSGEPLQQFFESSAENEIILKVILVRAAQKQYFALRKAKNTRYLSLNSRNILNESKRLESELDVLLQNYEKEVNDECV